MLRTQSQSQSKAASDASQAPLQAGLLQRKCDCGQHTIAGSKCSGCQDKQLSLQRALRSAELETQNSAAVPPIVQDVLNSPGEPLDANTRAFFEPRFGHGLSYMGVNTLTGKSQTSLTVSQAGDAHEQEADRMSERITGMQQRDEHRDLYDFSQVRVHSSPQAAESARMINAMAYTVGRNVVFAASQYAPTTAAGRRLLAHELTHMVQQSDQGSGLVQRSPDDAPNEVEQYVKFLITNKKVEGKPDSKKKALAMIDLKVKDEIAPPLPDDLEYLLILELAAGKPSAADVQGILEVLERMGGYELEKLFRPNRVNLDTLKALFTGPDKARLEDFFTRRFKGGLTQVQAGQIKSIGENVERGVPLSALEIIKKTITWLSTHKKTAAAFFSEVWSKSKIVLLGESHYDDVQRQFAAKMLADKGGKDVGLALEIDIGEQEEINYYIEHGEPPKGAKGWWKGQGLYKKLIDQAKATKTNVIAMDTHTGADRDEHMAVEVTKLAKSKSKVLVYVGAMHIKEFGNKALGEDLAAKFGGSSYAIDISHATQPDNIYWMINSAFPKEKSLGFDIDDSPLAQHPDPSAVAKPGFAKTLDGYIYFSGTGAYE